MSKYKITEKSESNKKEKGNGNTKAQTTTDTAHSFPRDWHLTRCVSNPSCLPGASGRENMAAGAEKVKGKT